MESHLTTTLQILTSPSSPGPGVHIVSFSISTPRAQAGWTVRLSYLWPRPDTFRPGDSPGARAGAPRQDLHHQPRPHPPQVRDEPWPRPGTQEQMGCK